MPFKEDIGPLSKGMLGSDDKHVRENSMSDVAILLRKIDPTI